VNPHDVPSQVVWAFKCVRHAVHEVPHEEIEVLIEQAPEQLW
jgi:hypothetical protein